MAFVLADRVKESTTSPGTGTATLLGAATGYQSFSSGIGANNTTYYVIADQNNGPNWEVGYGTIGAGGTTLARTTVLASSNSGSLVNFSSGTQDVWCDYPAGKAVYGLTAGTGISVTESAGAITVANTGVTSVTGTAPVVSSGGATPAISMAAANTSTNGYLTSTDWNTFNNKQPAGTYVTSVGATAPITSTGGTTPTIAIPAASGTTNGYLTSADWTTFNNKGSGTVTSVSGTTGRITSTGGTTPVIDLASGVATPGTTGSSSLIPVVTIDTYGRVTSITTAANPQGTVTSVTATSPVTSTGGATPVIAMPAATASVNGYLTSTDWTTFNNKGNGTVTSVSGTGTVAGLSLSGTVTGSGSLTLGGSLTIPSNTITRSMMYTTSNDGNAVLCGSDGAIFLNPNTINNSTTIPANYNGASAGPITIATGVTVTVSTGSSWVIT